jgi:hypothetical protein
VTKLGRRKAATPRIMTATGRSITTVVLDSHELPSFHTALGESSQGDAAPAELVDFEVLGRRKETFVKNRMVPTGFMAVHRRARKSSGDSG